MAQGVDWGLIWLCKGARIRNDIEFGVPHIWIVDPKTRTGWDYSDGNWVRRKRFDIFRNRRSIYRWGVVREDPRRRH